jgi:uncharacterized membrane protein YsdA (DUF1294 family)/cold shock CspA family protein
MTFENGKISSWNDDKGFGFITPKSGGKTIFIHINDFSKKHKRPMQGLSVNYQLSTDSNGRRCAINVYPKRGHKKVNKSDRQLSFSVFLSITFLCVVGGLVVLNKLPVIILGIYAIVSVLTFALYAKDKSAAQSGRWRTSESTLHLFSLIGGWPGAIVAQSRLRHKSKKISFRVVYWVTVIINCGVLGWLLTPEGTNRLNMILNHINIG